jgi:hypothetical protein
VRCLTRRARERCSIAADCCSGDFIGTKRIVGRVTASQIAQRALWESRYNNLDNLLSGLSGEEK